MREIAFEVQGSAPEPYHVIFVQRSQTNLSAYCSCPAGENGQYCKHRFAILEGATEAITSDNAHEVQTILAWLPGTDVELALQRMRSLEDDAKKIKRELALAKKEVALAMRN